MRISEIMAGRLSQYLEFRLGTGLVEDEYLYLHEKWYEITEISGGRVLGSPAGAPISADRELEVKPENLYVVMPAGAPIRFWCGQPHLNDWPDSELIYVEEAYCGVGSSRGVNTSKRLHGLFLLQRDPENGEEYYAPLDPGEQGIPAEWTLHPDRSRIVSWRPITASEILKAVIE